ncbi:MAG: folylpolyglutamate synthase/dihydrofolate synthase family protein [Candidatus Dormiibacterota bacterium]
MSTAMYDRAVATLDSVAWRGIMPGLERTRALLAALGNPQVGLRGALVAGTNGKGSVCATVDSICRAAGYRSVLLTSPHLVSYCERIVRDGVPIGETEFGALVDRVWKAAEALPEELQPTGFEVLTAAGILVAREADAEVLVCEVGLGGLLDSTNVLDLGVAAITNVALDHQDLLGETIPEIAREKAAIIKPGNRTVTAASEGGLDAVRARVAEVGATLSVVGGDVGFTGRSMGMGGVVVETVFDGRPVTVHAQLRGSFQVANIATAVAVCDALRATGIAVDIDAGAVLRGCESVRWRGRMDWIDGAPPILIDGAHNPAGMAAMVSAARELIGRRRCVAVFAAMRNKDVESMAAGLRRLTGDVVVTAPAVERATPPAELATLFDPPAASAADVKTALERARVRAGRDGVVVVCGSLYLAGEVIELLGV